MGSVQYMENVHGVDKVNSCESVNECNIYTGSYEMVAFFFDKSNKYLLSSEMFTVILCLWILCHVNLPPIPKQDLTMTITVLISNYLFLQFLDLCQAEEGSLSPRWRTVSFQF